MADMLVKPCPQPGRGMHRWLYGAFMTLLRAGYPPDRIEALLRGGPQESKAVVERFSGRMDFSRDAATVITMIENSDLPSGCFKIESRTNDFKEPEDFYVIREFPIFRRISAEEAASQRTDPKRKAQPDDLLDLIPPFPFDFKGELQKEISLAALYLAASNNEPSMGRDKVDNFIDILEDKKLIESFSKKSSEGGRGRGKKHLRRIKGFFH